MTTSTVQQAELDTPIGRMLLAVRAGRLCALGFADGRRPYERAMRRIGADTAVPGSDAEYVAGRLERYLAGALDALDDIAVDSPGTPFQRAVWEALRRIPPGTTTSYGAVARALGVPDAVRAVGAANGANPIAIVVPCHRVIGADGSLTGYAYGIERKRWLLAHEGALLAV